MKAKVIFVAALALVVAAGCRSKIDANDDSSEISTLGAEVTTYEVTLSAYISSGIDLSTVSEAGFLISDDENVPEGKAVKFSDTPTDHSISMLIKMSEFSAVRGAVYYYKAFAVINGQTFTGKANSFLVDPIHVSSITISPSSYANVTGKSIQFMATIIPLDATDKTVTWSSSAPEVASVDNNGLVKLLSKGKTVITVTSNDGNISSSSNVTVRNPAPAGAVDLGLSVYWAEKNLGASKPASNGYITDYGNYYSWGETSTKTTYFQSDYKFGMQPNFTKYNAKDQLTQLQSGDDAATKLLGGTWHTPTLEDWQELCNNCTITLEGTYGSRWYTFKSKINNNSITFPCGGVKFDDYWWYQSNQCQIMLSDMYPFWEEYPALTEAHYSYYYEGYPSEENRVYHIARHQGLNVRPVCD